MRSIIFAVALLMTLHSSRSSARSADLRAVDPDPRTGSSAAVIVGPLPLAHTAQILPTNANGQLAAANVPAAQTTAVLDRLDALLKPAGSALESAVRLNWYVTGDAHVDVVKKTLAARFRGDHKPSVTFVVTDLPLSGALVAVDAVAAASASGSEKRRDPAVDRVSPEVTVLPAGRVVYISGQAEQAADLVAATRATMQSLHRTLAYLNLQPEHAVHVKTFLTSMDASADVEREIAATFPASVAPPVSHVEWRSTLPIEIEMIAYLPDDVALPAEGETDAPARVRCFTPPGMTTSPVYSRVSVVEGGSRVYLSSLQPRAAGIDETAVRDLFDQLNAQLKSVGSDVNHLVKGTYYVSDDAVSGPFGKVRGEVYNPRRPPSASKATVRGIGVPDRSITVDLIAVTAE